jgi:hypothetical protein
MYNQIIMNDYIENKIKAYKNEVSKLKVGCKVITNGKVVLGPPWKSPKTIIGIIPCNTKSPYLFGTACYYCPGRIQFNEFKNGLCVSSGFRIGLTIIEEFITEEEFMI